MTDDDEQDPLERILTSDEEDRPDEVAVSDDGPIIDVEEFYYRLGSLADAADALVRLQEDIAALRQTGLDEQDARDLMYGRNSQLTKSDIDAIFGAIDDVERGSSDLLVRLLSDVSGLNLQETEEVVSELNRLREKYGGDDE